MGKKGGDSWLTVVKRAFRSPTKKINGKREEEEEEEEEKKEKEEKKRGKRRWLFRKSSNQGSVSQQSQAKKKTTMALATEQRNIIAEAETPITTAQVADEEVVRFRRPYYYYKEHHAAVVIQTAFRGYLARRALRALKGLVKLQALVRGHNVRKQTKMTLRCMQALIRVQTRMCDQRVRLSQDGSRNSMVSDNNSLCESQCFYDTAERRSMSRDGCSITEDWDDRIQTIDEIQAMLRSGKEDASEREKALAYASSHQIWRSGQNPFEETLEERSNWLDQGIITKPWEIRRRASTNQIDTIKTLEIDTYRPYSCFHPNFTRSHHQQTPQSLKSPLHRTHHRHDYLHKSPLTSSPSKTRPLQVRSDRSYNGMCSTINGAVLPNYMAATESAKARLRSQSAPKRWPSTPERERVEHLCYPVQDSFFNGRIDGYGNNLRSPSLRGIHGRHSALEQPYNLSSYCTDSFGGEISPCPTTDFKRDELI